MKKLIWKLEFKNGVYSAEYRIWFLNIYFLVLLPLIVVLWLFRKLYDAFWRPFELQEKTVRTNDHSKKNKKAIFKELLKP